MIIVRHYRPTASAVERVTSSTVSIARTARFRDERFNNRYGPFVPNRYDKKRNITIVVSYPSAAVNAYYKLLNNTGKGHGSRLLLVFAGRH